jgi:peptidoglycan/LPS O-acetylase OafA/YrhL
VGGDQGKFDFADALRGVACVTVVAAHLFGLFWTAPHLATVFANTVPVPAGTAHASFTYLTGAIPNFNLGAFGVALFFLISGFVIPISIERYSVPAFCVGRLCRIVPTYVVCFTVTLLAIALAGAHYGRPFPFSAGEAAIHYVPGARLLAGTRFIDPVIWTLEIEVVFYVICAAAAPLLRRRGGRSCCCRRPCLPCFSACAMRAAGITSPTTHRI